MDGDKIKIKTVYYKLNSHRVKSKPNQETLFEIKHIWLLKTTVIFSNYVGHRVFQYSWSS